MKKYILCLLLCMLLACFLTACGCEHTWAEATCLAPRTCTQCQKTEGETGAHSWAEATCTSPRTCTLCSATEGEAAEHIWEEATCLAPKTCTLCSAREGKVGEHDLTPEYLDGSDVTGICKVCGENATQHTDDAAGVAMQILAGNWTAVTLYNGGSETTEDVRSYNLVFEFREDGSAVSAIPGCAGEGTVSFAESNQLNLRYLMKVNGNDVDIQIVPHRSNQIIVWIPGYYSYFACEKN